MYEELRKLTSELTHLSTLVSRISEDQKTIKETLLEERRSSAQELRRLRSRVATLEVRRNNLEKDNSLLRVALKKHTI